MESMKQRLYRKANRILGIKTKKAWEGGEYVGRRKAVVHTDGVSEYAEKHLRLIKGKGYQEHSAYELDKAMREADNKDKRDLLNTKDIILQGDLLRN